LSTSPASIWELPGEEKPVEGLDEHGEPDPAYAAALGLVPAPLKRRALAAALDIGVFVLLQVTFVVVTLPLLLRLVTGRISWYGFVNHPHFILAVAVWGVSALLTIIFVVAQLAIQGRWGFTLGKLAAGIRVVNVKTLAKPGIGRSAIRAFEVWLPAVVVVGPIPFLASPSFAGREDRGRGWHDRAGHTWLVDSRHGLDPYDEKRMRIARKMVTSAPAARARALPSLATGADEAAAGGYRPGARTSAGVLGVARPHRTDGRVVVGLTGWEPGSAPDEDTDTADLGGPRLGAYLQRTSASAGAIPDESPAVPEPKPATPVPESQAAVTPAAPATPAASAVPPSPPAPAPAPAPKHLGTHGHTGDHGGGEPSSHGISLAFASGEQITLTSAVVVGRSPEPVHGARPFPLADPSSSLSKTHVVLNPVASGLEVIDQSSTNGTTIVHDGQEQKLAPGQVGLARTGDTVRFGDLAARVLSP